MAKKTYVEVLNQIEMLRKEADRLKREEADGVIRRIRDAVAAYGLTPDDIFGRAPRSKGAAARKGVAKKAAARSSKAASSAPYADGAGNTWGGRGPRPLWLREALAAGATLESFATAVRESAKADSGKPVAAKKGRGAATAKRGAPKRGATKRANGAKRAAAKQQPAAVSDTASQDTPANT